MARTIYQNTSDIEIAVMRMNQSRDKLADAIIAGNVADEVRLDKVYAAALADFKDLQAERRYFIRNPTA